MRQLLYVGQQTADLLANNVATNLDRYLAGDFYDLESGGDWRIPLSVTADVEMLADLVHERTREAEVSNSLLVGTALSALTPALARENRVWIRLSHVEGMEYSRKRWLENVPEAKLESSVRAHFFAPTWSRCRDDHAISRLWWNHRIASMLMPEDPGAALALILSSADIRSNFVERARIGSRIPLARSILRALASTEGLRQSESAFRKFMKLINLKGAGRVFEVWEAHRIDAFVDDCSVAALE